jgi:hypothetical protein
LRDFYRDSDSRRHLALAASRETEARVSGPLILFGIAVLLGCIVVAAALFLIIDDIIFDGRHRWDR